MCKQYGTMGKVGAVKLWHVLVLQSVMRLSNSATSRHLAGKKFYILFEYNYKSKKKVSMRGVRRSQDVFLLPKYCVTEERKGKSWWKVGRWFKQKTGVFLFFSIQIIPLIPGNIKKSLVGYNFLLWFQRLSSRWSNELKLEAIWKW